MQQNKIQYQPSPPISFPDDEIDLRELFSALWKGKWIILVISSVFAISSIIYAINQPNLYKSDVLIAPSETSNGGLSKMAGQLGGLAALAGVSIGSTESSQADLAIQVLKSRQFIESFIDEHNLLVPLMATKGWDMEANMLLVDEKVYDSKDQKWIREPKGLRGAIPTAQESYEIFSKNILDVKQDKESGLYSISIIYYSPFIAKQWVDWIVQDINKVMRERAITETTQNLAYLNSQLQKTSVADMQSMFYKLIEDQTKSLMLAESQEEFVFKTIDPAVVPEVKDKPRRAVICVLGSMLGIILGIVLVLCRYLLKR